MLTAHSALMGSRRRDVAARRPAALGGAGPARWAGPAPSLWSGYFLFALSIAAQASATAFVGSVPLSITDTIAFPKLPQ